MKLSTKRALELYEKASGDKVSNHHYCDKKRDKQIDAEIVAEMQAVVDAKTTVDAAKVLQEAGYGCPVEVAFEVWRILGKSSAVVCPYCGAKHRCRAAKPE